jgi:hypothetical protein
MRSHGEDPEQGITTAAWRMRPLGLGATDYGSGVFRADFGQALEPSGYGLFRRRRGCSLLRCSLD